MKNELIILTLISPIWNFAGSPNIIINESNARNALVFHKLKTTLEHCSAQRYNVPWTVQEVSEIVNNEILWQKVDDFKKNMKPLLFWGGIAYGMVIFIFSSIVFWIHGDVERKWFEKTVLLQDAMFGFLFASVVAACLVYLECCDVFKHYFFKKNSERILNSRCNTVNLQYFARLLTQNYESLTEKEKREAYQIWFILRCCKLPRVAALYPNIGMLELNTNFVLAKAAMMFTADVTHVDGTLRRRNIVFAQMMFRMLKDRLTAAENHVIYAEQEKCAILVQNFLRSIQSQKITKII
ncbi:hypothetical protein KAZ82_02625 [Candidatus Babeliales bacterium]|nr:hypothetical protein [Candidatus Babeliales bacterium]